MSEVSFDEWRGFLQGHPNIHILQTAEWGELKSAFGWSAVRLINAQDGLQLLFRNLPFGFTLAYAPKVDFSKQENLISTALWTEIDEVCRKKKAVFLKIEPDAWDDQPIKFGSATSALQKSPYNIQPPRTIVLSLVGTLDDILARMKQKCRYNIRLAEKKDVTIRPWGDPDGFYELMRVTGGRDGFGVHSRDYYRRVYQLFHPVGKVEMLVAEFEGRPLAALMVFAQGERSWYLYGASNDVERNRMPAYLLQWEAIKWAKQRGCTTYDLWGVPDEDEAALEDQFENRHEGLWGVYRFKRGFGGQLKRAAQALDRVYMPWLYRLYLLRMGKDE